MTAGSDVLVDESADFTKLDLDQTTTTCTSTGTRRTAGVNDNELDDIDDGDLNSQVYRIEEGARPEPASKCWPAAKEGRRRSSYSIGKRSYFKHVDLANCDFFVCDTRGQRQMHDTREPVQADDISMLGQGAAGMVAGWDQEFSEADFIFVVSSP